MFSFPQATDGQFEIEHVNAVYFFVRGHGGRSLHFVLRSGRNLGKGRELIIHARGFGEAYFLRDHGGSLPRTAAAV